MLWVLIQQKLMIINLSQFRNKMKKLYYILQVNLPEIKSQVMDFHQIAIDVLTCKHLRTSTGLTTLVLTLFIGMSLTSQLFGIFFIFYFIDFLTGFLASKVQLEKKKAENPDMETPPYLVQSNKIIRGLVKLSAYFIIFGLGYIVELILKTPNVNIHSSIVELTPLQVAVIIAISSEVVSNFENSKKAGFDVIGNILKFLRTSWKIFSTIKNKTDETSN